MATFQDTYVGFAEESTYGTQVAPTTYVEFLSEGLSGKYERIESEGLRAGAFVLRSDRFAVNPKGAEGDLKVEAMDTGLTTLLKHAFGAVSAAAPAGGFTVSTFTLGTLQGKSLSMKVGRVSSDGTMNHFDYLGTKVKSFELANAVDGILSLSLDLDCAGETIGATSATPTYNTFSTQLLTFVGASCTVAGSAFVVNDISVKVDNALNVERYGMRGASSTTKREPLSEGLKAVSFDLKGEFESLAHLNRVAAATAAGATAALSIVWASPQGGQLTVSIPVARFDDAGVNVDGAKILEQPLSGMGLHDGSQAPITCTYKEKTS